MNTRATDLMKAGAAATVRRTAVIMAQGVGLFALGIAQIPLALIVLLGLALSIGLGLVFLFSPVVRLTRAWTGLARRLAQGWSGIEIAQPYQPMPPPPVRQRDGWYREGRNLYKSARIPAYTRRLNWLFKDPATWRDLAWLLCYPLSGGLIAALPVGLPVYGVALILMGHLVEILVGVLLIAGGLIFATRIPRLYGLWSQTLLGPTENTRLSLQVRHLTRTRTEAVDSQTAELHRIERDLHDGAQARLVAMGMTLGAAEELIDSDPGAAKALLAKTREASATALAELRQLVRGIHPPVLAERGLPDAVRALALDSPLTVAVTVDLPVRPEPPVESAAYFAISELLANAARHADAGDVTIDISRRGTALRVTVTDDGMGGADPASGGSGLRGLERRLAAFDGVLALNSPPGGPTVATFELPRALEGYHLDKPSMPKWKKQLMGVCWGLFWLPLFPQGLVALVMKLVGAPERSWFLALYLPGALSWVAIIVAINLGIAMIIMGVRLSVLYDRASC